MIKAGLIGAVIGFIYIMTLTLFSPFCTFCLTPLLGISVGYIAGWFDRPLRVDTSLRRGGIAGGITGLGVVLGQMLAAAVNAILVTNSEQLPIMMREMGLSQFVITNGEEYWQATLTMNSFCGIFNLALVVGLGATGSLIWFQQHNKSSLPSVSS